MNNHKVPAADVCRQLKTCDIPVETALYLVDLVLRDQDIEEPGTAPQLTFNQSVAYTGLHEAVVKHLASRPLTRN